MFAVGIWLSGTISQQTADLRKHLKRSIAKFRDFEKSGSQRLYQGGLEDVSERDPIAEAQKGVQRGRNQATLVRGRQYLLAQREDLRKLVAHGRFQVSRLSRGHLVGRVVKDFFGEKAEDNHIVLADGQVRPTGGNNFVDEGWPVMGPLLLEDGDEHKIQLVEEGPVCLEGLLGVGGLDDEVDDEVANA